MAAKEETLGLLHELTADHLMRRLRAGDMTAAELAVAVKFLKDNGIETDPDNEKMKALQAKAAATLDYPFDPASAH
jgi:hypothetical protein